MICEKMKIFLQESILKKSQKKTKSKKANLEKVRGVCKKGTVGFIGGFYICRAANFKKTAIVIYRQKKKIEPLKNQFFLLYICKNCTIYLPCIGGLSKSLNTY